MLGFAFIVFLVFAILTARHEMADRAAAQSQLNEQNLIQKLSNGRTVFEVHEVDLVGQRWRAGKNGEDQRIYNFGVDGALAVTVATPSPNGSASARVGHWRLKQGWIQILAENGAIAHSYQILGYANGKVYVRSTDGSVESYYTGKD